jgi:hypothetical protein
VGGGVGVREAHACGDGDDSEVTLQAETMAAAEGDGGRQM